MIVTSMQYLDRLQCLGAKLVLGQKERLIPIQSDWVYLCINLKIIWPDWHVPLCLYDPLSSLGRQSDPI